MRICDHCGSVLQGVSTTETGYCPFCGNRFGSLFLSENPPVSQRSKPIWKWIKQGHQLAIIVSLILCAAYMVLKGGGWKNLMNAFSVMDLLKSLIRFDALSSAWASITDGIRGSLIMNVKNLPGQVWENLMGYIEGVVELWSTLW